MPGIPFDDDWLPLDLEPERRFRRRRRLQIIAGVFFVGFLLGRWSDSGPTSTPGHRSSSLEVAVHAEMDDLADLYGPCEATRVIDGDTIDVDCGRFRDRVRMLRIDTPERGQAGYREAAEALADMLDGEDVYLGFEDSQRPTRGRYGRLLAYVYADDRNLNVEMVRQGWSPFWTKYGTGRLARTFTAAEREAQRRGRGIWSGR